VLNEPCYEAPQKNTDERAEGVIRLSAPRVRAFPADPLKHMTWYTTVVCFVVCLCPFLYVGMFAGDAEIHLVYGERAALGHFFEFNGGEKSAGVTSPGYMLLVAALFKSLPAFWVPAALKAINLLGWYGLVLLVFLVTSRLTENRACASLAALVAGVLPGSVYNATIGMENGLFGLFVLFWFYTAIRSGWFDSRSSLKTEVLLGGWLGMTGWIRPEGVLLGVLAVICRAMPLGRRQVCTRRMWRGSVIFLAPFIVVNFGLAIFHWRQTGVLLPASGLSRIVLGSATWIGAVPVNGRVAQRLLLYLPLTILWVLGSWLLATGRLAPKRCLRGAGFLVVMSWLYLGLYSTAFGAAHLARYLIFVMPAYVIVASLAAVWAWRTAPNAWLRATIVTAAALWLGGAFTAETVVRLRLGPSDELLRAMRAPEERRAYSDQLFRDLEELTGRRISVALQEVQIRYWLDDRFVVRSLDGRVDPVLLKYVKRGNYDHVGYLRERGVDYVLGLAHYNRDPTAWSLERLRDLPPGASISREGVTFSRLSTNPGIYRVASTP